MTFTSQYIEVKKFTNETYKRIIFGIKNLKKSFKNYFFRSVTGKNNRPINRNVT
jgi:hypothetical protein